MEAETPIGGCEGFTVSRQTRPDPFPELRDLGNSHAAGLDRVPARGLINFLDVAARVRPLAAGEDGHLPAEDRWPKPGPPSI